MQTVSFMDSEIAKYAVLLGKTLLFSMKTHKKKKYTMHAIMYSYPERFNNTMNHGCSMRQSPKP